MKKAKYIMIGGFLGAGKSTSVVALAQRLHAQELRVGLITNDQGHGLVDTAFMRSHGFPVEEIAGGCFCCRFDSLREASDRLAEDEHPDVFIAEPVGSCTDLMATVTYPLRRMYGDAFEVTPLSVVVDPVRALRVLGVEEGANFSSKVLYVYRKQLEEARAIVINKCDSIESARVEALRGALVDAYPEAEIFVVSAREGDGLDAWFDFVLNAELVPGDLMEVDYALYGEGEALLGWLNATVDVAASAPVDGTELLASVAERMRLQLRNVDAQIAHLKMTLAPDDGSNEVAVINCVNNDVVAEAAQSLLDPLATGKLIVNLRAEADPAMLDAALHASLADLAVEDTPVTLTIHDLERFRPGQPVPVYRESGISRT